MPNRFASSAAWLCIAAALVAPPADPTVVDCGVGWLLPLLGALAFGALRHSQLDDCDHEVAELMAGVAHSVCQAAALASNPHPNLDPHQVGKKSTNLALACELTSEGSTWRVSNPLAELLGQVCLPLLTPDY